METKLPEIYAICSMDSIAVGDAKAFDLAKVDKNGESRPFRIVIIRETPFIYRGYVNVCPHEGVWLNIGTGVFFDFNRTISKVRQARGHISDRHWRLCRRTMRRRKA